MVQAAKKRAAARDLAWAAFAETAGVPPVVPSSMNAAARRDAAQVVTAGGGVLKACASWEHGEETEAVRALFIPFGGLEPHERDDVVDLLRRHRDYAEDLWESACRAAGKPAVAAA